MEEVRSRQTRTTISCDASAYGQSRPNRFAKPGRNLSPLAEHPEHFECRLPNDDENYSMSPAARRAMNDGSLDPGATFFNRTFNRKLKMRDTFTKIFPSYTHGIPSVSKPSHAQLIHKDFKINDLGGPMHLINREYTHKKDAMKNYHESILKIANMRRGDGKKK